jgi:hypothetical protein
MDKEKRRLYNKQYREIHSDRIEEYLCVQKTCINCGKVVRHQNMTAHKRSNYCKNHSHQPIIESKPKLDIIKVKKSEIEQYVDNYKIDLLQTFQKLVVSK